VNKREVGFNEVIEKAQIAARTGQAQSLTTTF
jgi:hypothetical protein